jgi:hypothetical protein|tara:strand:- start:33 stop:233 length:201 start_codon:yes stop_codon:yes gene_type:complete
MKSKLILYRVYNHKGEYHHGYSPVLKGSLGWAIDCAKTVNGSVKEIFDDETSKEVFSCTKEIKCSP